MKDIHITGGSYGSVWVSAESADSVTVNRVPVSTMCLEAVTSILRSQLARSDDVVIRRLVLACKMRLEVLDAVYLTQTYAEGVLLAALMVQHEHDNREKKPCQTG